MTNPGGVKWEQVALGDACEIVNGGTPKTKVGEYWGGPHAWVTPAEMGRLDSPFVRTTKRTLSDKGLKKSSASLLPEYSVILSSRAPIGHLVINETPMATNQGCRGLVAHEKLHYKFLYYFLLSNVRLLNDLGTGATFKELSATKLKRVLMPIPSIAEQKRIVAILDEAFAAIATATANTKKNIANAQELFESQLERAFTGDAVNEGWDLSRIEDIAESVVYGHTASAENGESGTKFLRITDIQDGSVDWQTVPTCECDLNDQVKYRLESGDIVFARTGATTGKSFLIVECPEGAIFASYLIRVRPGKGVLSEYLAHYFYSPTYWEQISKSATGSAQPGVNASKLKKLQIPLPSLPEQKRIATFLDKLSSEKQTLVKTYETKIHSLTELKQSLLHQAFTGELTSK